MLKLNIITIQLFLFSIILNSTQALAISGKEIRDLIKEHLLIQGINLGNLALSESSDTPFSVFEVIDIGPNQSSLMPLNSSRNIKHYYGKTITFMEF